MDNEHIENTTDFIPKISQIDDSNNSTLDIVGYDVKNNSDIAKEMPNIEWDETIDYNFVENIGTIENKRKTCSKEKPLQTIALVKCRYNDNEPFTNVMYRYGDINQLTFALAKRSSFESYRPWRFHPSFIDTSLLFTNHVHMLINSPYQHSTVKRFMSKDTVFIAIIYDPIKVHLSNLVEHFALQRYKSKTKLKIIQKLYMKEEIIDMQYINTIAADFGYPLNNFNHDLTPNDFIHELENQFDVVLIGDYVEESLVLLKDLLCWSFNDIAFLSSKKNNFYPDIPDHLKLQIKTRNNMDQIIYEHFNETFWEKVHSYGAAFSSDLEELKSLKVQVNHDCSGKEKTLESERTLTLGFTFSKGNIEPLCKKMRWTELDYISYLKQKPPSITDDILDGLKYLNHSISNFYNTTSKEILRLESL